MIKTLMHHRVKDFSNWKKAFDNFSPTRKLKGEISYEVGRSHEDPNDVYVINEWRSVKDFNSFMQNPDLKDLMENAGVLEEPHIMIIDEVDKGMVH